MAGFEGMFQILLISIYSSNVNGGGGPLRGTWGTAPEVLCSSASTAPNSTKVRTKQQRSLSYATAGLSGLL